MEQETQDLDQVGEENMKSQETERSGLEDSNSAMEDDDSEEPVVLAGDWDD